MHNAFYPAQCKILFSYLFSSCPNTTSPGLAMCNLPNWKQACDDVLSSNYATAFPLCPVDSAFRVSCKTDICPFEGTADQDTKIKGVICGIARRIMRTECDVTELLPENLPAYCKSKY